MGFPMMLCAESDLCRTAGLPGEWIAPAPPIVCGGVLDFVMARFRGDRR